MHCTLLPNGIKIFQPRQLPRFSIDALLLASHIKIPRAARILEIGSASGVISLILSQKFRESEFFS
ncbi:hypothetical protein ACFL35_15495, partial [Candidatus Riflebacteria bacterium]